MNYLDAGGFKLLPGIAERPQEWETLRQRLESKVFLHSEGVSVTLGPPVVASPELTRKAEELVTRFNRFSTSLARAYFAAPERAEDFLVNPLLAPLIELDRDAPIAIPTSRFDCVLDNDGELHVIEHNAVGICLFHFRNLFYVIRGMAANGFEADARRLDRMTEQLAGAFRRYYEAISPKPKAVPTIGSLQPSGWLRGAQRLFRAAFERNGWRYVFGGPEHFRVDDGGVYVRGEKVDLLWSDFLFYIAYQTARYQETRFASPVADFGNAPLMVNNLLHNPVFIKHLRDRTVVNMGPGLAYLALAKPLLSWLHRDDVPIKDPDLDWLRRHMPRTYSERERREGVITQDQVTKDKERYVIKPALYGGGHGVQLGHDTPPDQWSDAVAKMWTDTTWSVQEVVVPAKTSNGDWISVGIQNYDGKLGGFLLRTSRALCVNARESSFVPGLAAE